MRKALTTSLFIAALMTSTGCATAGGVDEKADDAQQQAEVLDVEKINPVNNSPDAVSVCNREPDSGVIVTFDDYGTPADIENLLEVLEDLDWRAAFFPIGEWSLDNWNLIMDMQQAGHIVGSHTMTHADLVELLADEDIDGFYREIYPLEDFATTSPMLLRPPYGSGLYDEEVADRLAERDIQMCGWTSDTNDWRGGSADELLDRVLNGYDYSPDPLEEGGVVLAHMSEPNSIEFVQLLAAELDSRGWSRESLSGGR